MKSAEEIRKRLLQKLNTVLSVPGMCMLCDGDLEIAIRGLLGDLYFVDEVERDDKSLIADLISQGVYYPSNVVCGVSTVFRNILPEARCVQHLVASVYARLAHESGYLECAHILTEDELTRLRERVIAGEFCFGYDLQMLKEKLPSPSYTTGRTTLCYFTDTGKEWLYFDLPTRFILDKGRVDVLCSIRWAAGSFEEGFELTKEGYEYSRRGIAIPQHDGDTFIEEWKAGRKWLPNENPPTIAQDPQPSRWEHLW